MKGIGVKIFDEKMAKLNRYCVTNIVNETIDINNNM